MSLTWCLDIAKACYIKKGYLASNISGCESLKS